MIDVDDVTKSFRKGDVHVDALRGVTCHVPRGRFAFIVGPSGSGKSTLLYLMGALDRPSSGTIKIDGADLTAMSEVEQNAYRRDKIGFIFQAFNLIGDLTVYENVELPLTYRTGDAALDAGERRRRVVDALEKVGMAHRTKHYPAQLSGGQQQRVAVARAVAGEPAILLADEPTGNLDSQNGEAVMGLLQELHRGGATICMVTHDERYAQHADRSVRLFDGRVVEDTRNVGVRRESAAPAVLA